MEDIEIPVPVLREFCAENLTHVAAALEAGAERIELCDNLAVGGTTPSAGVIWKACEAAHAEGARVMCMVRPRGGDFCYDLDELQATEADISVALDLGADGIVLGCLAPCDAESYVASREVAIAAGDLPGAGYAGGFAIDYAALDRLCSAARAAASGRQDALDITFHMAFDALPDEAQDEALELLPTFGVTRVLSHGGAAGTRIEDNLDRLRALIERAPDGLTVLPGAGITHGNADAVARSTGAWELHGTRIVELSRPVA